MKRLLVNNKTQTVKVQHVSAYGFMMGGSLIMCLCVCACNHLQVEVKGR